MSGVHIHGGTFAPNTIACTTCVYVVYMHMHLLGKILWEPSPLSKEIVI
jgi:hypothetical protein